MRNAWLIYNPAAGRFPSGWLLSRAVRVLSEGGWEIFVQETELGQDLGELAAEAARQGCEAVFVAGGDGSVGKVAAALSGTETALGVLPSGTANVWAQEMGLPPLDWNHLFALEDSATRLARGEIRAVDIGEANGTSFLMWAGVGLDATIINSIEPRERWEKSLGAVGYALQGVWTSLDWDGIELEVRSGGKTWRDRYLVAVASNIRTYAGGVMQLTPDALIDDGLLDFWLIRGRSFKDAIVRVAQIMRGTHVDAPGVVHFKAEEAVFEAQDDVTMHFDGEPQNMPAKVTFHTHRQALKVLFPTDKPR
jgi:YegS/Rv2252/BmrU family lipid kinase